VVINLAPSDMKKRGTHYDLAMAIGLLNQSEQLMPLVNLKKLGFIGELSLNAFLRPCTGVLPMAIRAKEMGLEQLIVPQDNVSEASLVQDIDVYGFRRLQDVVDFLRGGLNITTHERPSAPDPPHSPLDFKEVQGQDTLIEYLVLAAAGGHNMLMIGPPGCGKSMIAKRIPTILPSMTEEESLEVTKIYSVAGILKNRGDLIRDRPFRDPHHNASTNSLIGGGKFATPGEIFLAHHGVLFLDEIAEFHKKTLDALRQPIEDRTVTITRVKTSNTYPCNFMLVAAMNPCPCGYYGQAKCRCTDYEVFKYQQTISGPILDRMDVQKYVQPVDFFALTNGYQGRSSKELRERVESARFQFVQPLAPKQWVPNLA
jgi:magnesium chelatase family protein